MLEVEFTLTILNLIIMVGAAIIAGYLVRSRQLQKKQQKISELRKEIVYNHAQILELQSEYVNLEKTLNITTATVLPMNNMKQDVQESVAL